MARSFARGDYALVMAVESASRPSAWYRILADRESGELSCDCPRWLHARNGVRSCKHVEAAAEIRRAAAILPPDAPRDHPLIGATQSQWPGLTGEWRVDERDSRVGSDRYRSVSLQLETPDGHRARGIVAFALRHGLEVARLIPGVAGWAGYAVAAQVAQRAGFATVGAPPEHFRFRSERGRQGRVALHDILRVGDAVDLGDGLRPAERAENTLRLFLGDSYELLERQGFLDVSSTLYASDRRVYRLRRDPTKRRARRIRVMEQGQYVRDLCVVPAAQVPEADHFLTVFLQLCASEQTVLSVVRPYNIFAPFSDGREPENVPAVWRERVAVAA